MGYNFDGSSFGTIDRRDRGRGIGTADYTPFIAVRRTITAFNLSASLRAAQAFTPRRRRYANAIAILGQYSIPSGRLSPRSLAMGSRSLPRFGHPFLSSANPFERNAWKFSYLVLLLLPLPRCFQIGNLSSHNFFSQSRNWSFSLFKSLFIGILFNSMISFKNFSFG